jgi:serine/threonine protein kinase
MARDAAAWLPKIADFGIVATKESSTAYTRTGGTLLTMAYAAPEQWRGTPAASLDGRTDLYALGGLLYEMLTGQTPFHAENYEGWAHQHQTTPPQPPSTLRPDLANWQNLDALVLRLLAKDRNDRPKDVAELFNLIDAVRHLPPEARRETVIEDGGKRSRRVPAWVWAASAAMFLVAGFFTARIFLLRLRTGQQIQQSSQQSSSPKVAQAPEQPSADPLTADWSTAVPHTPPKSSSRLTADWSTAVPYKPPAASPQHLAISIPLTPPAVQSQPGGGAQEAALTWTDPATVLMWAKKDNGSDVNWQQATGYCRKLQLAGNYGWRLPTIDELQGIYDQNANIQGQWADGSPVTWHEKGNLHLSGWEWSSSQGDASGEAWGFPFSDGKRLSLDLGHGYGTRALCVRSSRE